MKCYPEVHVLWVDDDKDDHLDDAKNLECARKGLCIEMFHPLVLHSKLLKLRNSGEMPDLFLVDYYLDLVANGKNGKFKQRGLSVAGMIREIDPERPIYVITQQETKVEGIFYSVAQAARECFDRILMFKEIQREEGPNILYYDALDHRAIRESLRGDLKALFELLQAPDDVTETLKLVLPNELKNGLSAKKSTKHPEGNVIAFARWTREILLRVPGFLYEELYASTHLGMLIDSFREISPRLKKARYSGIFARTSPPLWWVSELNDIVFSNQKAWKIDKTNLWEVAPTVFSTPKEGLAKCEVCGESFPETVGINLKDDKDLKPVHYRCSRPYLQKRKRELYFDEPRGFEVKKIS